jgi:hypothetical protein
VLSRRLAAATVFLVGGVALVAAAGSIALGPYPSLGGCGVFPRPDASVPANARSLPNQRAWNQDVSQAPLAPNSGRIIDYINAHGDDFLHPDFGSPRGYGFPYTVVGEPAAAVPVHFTLYGDESDHGTYRVPLGAPVEGGAGAGGDRHVLVYDRYRCLLYELGRAFPNRELGRWDATVGVIWNLRSAALRTEGWTSADAAGLPIFPGLVRYDEIQAGHIDHAIRVTFDVTREAWIHPGSHCAGSTSSVLAPPMGMRLRLDDQYDLSGFTGAARVIGEALKHYGFLVADNGSNWFFGGTSDSRWDDDNLNQLKEIPGSAFEVVRSQAPVQTC